MSWIVHPVTPNDPYPKSSAVKSNTFGLPPRESEDSPANSGRAAGTKPI